MSKESIGDYISNDDYLSDHGADLSTSLDHDAEMDALASGDCMNSSLSQADFHSQTDSVQETGNIDTLTSSIFDNL